MLKLLLVNALTFPIMHFFCHNYFITNNMGFSCNYDIKEYQAKYTLVKNK